MALKFKRMLKLDEKRTQGVWYVDLHDEPYEDGTIGISGNEWGDFARAVIQMEDEKHRSKTGKANAELIGLLPELLTYYIENETAKKLAGK